MSMGCVLFMCKVVFFIIVVIGCGFCGIFVLEWIVVRLVNECNVLLVIGDICIYVVDVYEIGGGCIWCLD